MKTAKRLLPGLGLFLVTCTGPHTGVVPVYHDVGSHFGMVDDSIPAMRIPPPPIYLVWMAEIIRCSGIVPDSMPDYWVAALPNFARRHGALGFYVGESHRVVMGLGYEAVAFVVRHENLHHVLEPYIPPPTGPETFEQAQKRQHPVEYFGGKDSTGTMIHGKCQDLVFPSPLSPESPQQSSSTSPHS